MNTGSIFLSPEANRIIFLFVCTSVNPCPNNISIKWIEPILFFCLCVSVWVRGY